MTSNLSISSLRTLTMHEPQQSTAVQASSEVDAKCQAIFHETTREDFELSHQRLSLIKPSAFASEQPSFRADFKYFTKYIPNLSGILKAAKNRSGHIDELCYLLSKGDWNCILRNYSKTPDELAYDGLKAYYDGFVSTEQFATLLSVRSLLIEFRGVKLSTQQMFEEDGSVNPVAKAIISGTVLPTGVAKAHAPFLNEKQLEMFFEQMRQQPASEKVLFFVKMDPYDSTNLNPGTMRDILFKKSKTVTKEITMFMGFNVFHQFKHQEEFFRLVPSLTMMQKFLEVYARAGHAIKITPVIGLSSMEDIYNNIVNNTRDMGFSFPGVQLPQEADHMAAPYSADFTAHDFYHAFVASDIPEHLRLAYKEYADILKSVQQEFNASSEVYKFINFLYERIIDMEHSIFRQNLTSSNDSKYLYGKEFLLSLMSQQNNALKRQRIAATLDSRLKEGDPDVLDQDIAIELEKSILKVQQSDLFEKIALRLFNTGFWQRFKISQEDLKQLSLSFEKQKQSSLDSLLTSPDKTPCYMKKIVEVDGKAITRQELIRLIYSTSHKTHLPSLLLELYDNGI